MLSRLPGRHLWSDLKDDDDRAAQMAQASLLINLLKSTCVFQNAVLSFKFLALASLAPDFAASCPRTPASRCRLADPSFRCPFEATLTSSQPSTAAPGLFLQPGPVRSISRQLNALRTHHQNGSFRESKLTPRGTPPDEGPFTLSDEVGAQYIDAKCFVNTIFSACTLIDFCGNSLHFFRKIGEFCPTPTPLPRLPKIEFCLPFPSLEKL